MLNDVWRFDGRRWYWLGGSTLGNQPGVYGVLGQAAAANIPGARAYAAAWRDAAGLLWMFGGQSGRSPCCPLCAARSLVTASAGARLNDVWRFDGALWAWMGGSNMTDQRGAYGTRGVADAANIPGARYGAAVWTDANRIAAWLFGGSGIDAFGNSGVRACAASWWRDMRA
jgi:hypothetical protein